MQTVKVKAYMTNLYNPPPFSHRSTESDTLKNQKETLSKESYHIFVGDFNLHHPIWGGQKIVNHHKLAEDLIKNWNAKIWNSTSGGNDYMES